MKPSRHVVLITGGVTGIGFALAKTFHAAGNRVIIVGRSEKKLAAAAASLPGISTCAADVSCVADRDKLVATYSDVSILINNAGIQNIVTILNSTQYDIEQERTVNFLAPVLLCRAFLPLLVQREEAAIVNVTSGLALVPKQTAAMYCPSKAALHSFSKALRWQLEGTAVKVFEVLPPVVDTAMTRGVDEQRFLRTDWQRSSGWAGCAIGLKCASGWSSCSGFCTVSRRPSWSGSCVQAIGRVASGMAVRDVVNIWQHENLRMIPHSLDLWRFRRQYR